MRLVSYNIQYGLGKDGAVDLARIAAELVAIDADIIALQEVEVGWRRSGNQHQASILANLLPDYFSIYLPAFDMHAAMQGGLHRRQFGNMLLCRQPIWQARLFPLPKWPVAGEFNMDLGVIEALVNTSAGPLRLHVLQLSSVSAAERLAQAEAVLALHAGAVARGAAWSGPAQVRGAVDWSNGETPPPTTPSAIFLGDFNFAPDSDEYRRLISAGLVDCWRHLGLAEAEGMTYPAQPAWPQALRIDHVFLTADLAPRALAARVDHQALGADHNPLILDLNLDLLPPV